MTSLEETKKEAAKQIALDAMKYPIILEDSTAEDTSFYLQPLRETPNVTVYH